MHRNMIGLQRSMAATQAGLTIRDLLIEAQEAPTEWEAEHLRRDADRALDALIERKEQWAKDPQGNG